MVTLSAFELHIDRIIMKCEHLNTLSLGLFCVTLLAGCGESGYSTGSRYHFQPYTVLEGTDQVMEYTLPPEQARQLDDLLLGAFGTPAAPQVNNQELQKEIADMRLSPEMMAMGSKYYLAQCANCHGKEGNGNGKTAATLNPKPRDYRFGKFKYVSTMHRDEDGKTDTGKASYPAHSDLVRTIRIGLPGAGMSAFEQSDAINEAIASYVIHLSLRGQVEYRLMRYWLEEGEKPEEKDVARELKEILKQWARDAASIYVPNVPWEEVERVGNNNQWARGRELFLGTAGCIDCHGKDGKANPDELKNIAAMKDDWGGAIKPRSFVSEPFRGGERPIDLFYRIRLGIKPSRMQAIDMTKFQDVDVWNLVGYIRSLKGKQ